MASEATKIEGRNTREPSPIRATMTRLSEVVEMSFDLVSLQSQLVQQDAETAKSQIKPALLSILVAIGFLLCGVPLLAFGLASGLSEWAEIHLWIAQLVMAMVFLFVGITLLFYAWRVLAKSSIAFEPSRREGIENLKWIRKTIYDSLH